MTMAECSRCGTAATVAAAPARRKKINDHGPMIAISSTTNAPKTFAAMMDAFSVSNFLFRVRNDFAWNKSARAVTVNAAGSRELAGKLFEN
jgi:hypothetical protein